MFTCHLDTVYTDLYYGIYEVDIKHVIDGDFIKTNEYTNLGADDKAGMVIMLNMINEKVPGLYYFFQGEETGRIGSSKLSAIFNDLVTASKLPKIDMKW
jgi:di/tripeptidase